MHSFLTRIIRWMYAQLSHKDHTLHTDHTHWMHTQCSHTDNIHTFLALVIHTECIHSFLTLIQLCLSDCYAHTAMDIRGIDSDSESGHSYTVSLRLLRAQRRKWLSLRINALMNGESVQTSSVPVSLRAGNGFRLQASGFRDGLILMQQWSLDLQMMIKGIAGQTCGSWQGCELVCIALPCKYNTTISLLSDRESEFVPNSWMGLHLWVTWGICIIATFIHYGRIWAKRQY